MTANWGPREGSEQPSGEAPGFPTRRPRWLTALTVLMLLMGARLFLGSLTDLRRLVTGRSMVEVSLEGLADANQELLIRGQLALDEAVDRAHPVAAELKAGVRFLLALLLLFAVAAVFSSDPRAGRVGRAAGWGGMAYYLGNGAFLLLVVRRGVGGALPVLQQVAARAYARTGDAPPAPADLAQLASTLTFQLPLLATTLGVAFSILLLIAFGGRRRYLFYNRGERAHHG